MILEVKNIFKKFGNLQVLNDVSFTINKDEYVAIIGKNVARKITLLNILLGLLSTDSGSIKYFRKNFSENITSILYKIG